MTATPPIVDRETWQEQMEALRVREKAHTREGDAIAAARRRLPMVEVDPGTPVVGPPARSRSSTPSRAGRTRHSVVRGAVMSAFRATMHSERWLGERTRRRLGREISDLGNLENEALGIELGYRYDGSPVVCHEPDGQAPVHRMDDYTPSTWPGARPPSVYLADGRAIFDLLGRGAPCSGSPTTTSTDS
jgi:hypothetical protein